MIISDLTYLEVATEASSVVGGGSKKKEDKKKDDKKKNDNYKNAKINVAIVKQDAEANSAAISGKYGKSFSVAVAKNESEVNQANVG